MAVERTQSIAWKAWAVVGLCSSVIPAAAAKPPEPGFWLTGVPPGSATSAVTGLTQDGSVASGATVGSFPTLLGPGFTWTKSGGRNDFGLLPGMPKITGAVGISDTGVLAGLKMIDASLPDSARAYRWTGTGPLQDLGLLPGETRSFAYGISGDGSVVVGHAEHGPNGNFTGQAFRWTAASGMQGLGKLTPGSLISFAEAVSRDGSTIVGSNINELLFKDAFVWTQGTGMKVLASLIGDDANALAVNVNGTVVAGSAQASDGTAHAVRWANGSIEDLAATFGLAHSLATSISDEGSVVCGNYSKSGPGGHAFVWSATMGMLDAQDYLALAGVNVPINYQIEDIFTVSGDGLTVGGKARNLTTGVREGFVATVPRVIATPTATPAAGWTLTISFVSKHALRSAIHTPTVIRAADWTSTTLFAFRPCSRSDAKDEGGKEALR